MEQFLFESFKGLFVQLSAMALLFGLGFIFVLHRLAKMKQQISEERAKIIEVLMDFIALKLNIVVTTENVNYEGLVSLIKNITSSKHPVSEDKTKEALDKFINMEEAPKLVKRSHKKKEIVSVAGKLYPAKKKKK